MKDRLVEIAFNISHEGCWTSLVNNYIVKNLSLSFDTEKDYIRSIIIVDRKYKDLINKIKRTKNFIETISLQLTNDDRNILFDFRKKYRGSVIETIHSVDGIVLEGFKYQGKEYWRVLMYESYIRELKEKLESKGKFEILYINPLNVNEYELSQQQLKILYLAYKYGYFDFPRSKKSDEISKLIGISKSTFTYHLRAAESKILKKLLDSLKFYNSLVIDKPENKE